MTEITIEITTYCPYADECTYCSTGATSVYEEAEFLTWEQIYAFIGGRPLSVINISGGEPMFHPEIGKILWACQKFAPEVVLYTNMINSIRYNTDFVKDIKVEANVCLIAGKPSYIPKAQIDVRTHVLKLVHQGKATELPNQDIVVSSNFCIGKSCADCNHKVLQADGNVVEAPCKKETRG